MSTGRRNPGPERAGSGIDAHRISPRFTTRLLKARRLASGARFSEHVSIEALVGFHLVRVRQKSGAW
jgi:hypothetical protein